MPAYESLTDRKPRDSGVDAARRRVQAVFKGLNQNGASDALVNSGVVADVREVSDQKGLELSKGSEESPRPEAGLDTLQAPEPDKMNDLPAIRLRIESIHDEQTRLGKPHYPTEL